MQKNTKENHLTGPQKASYPPLALLKTWMWMLLESNDTVLASKGRAHIIKAFGSLAKADEYFAKITGNKSL